MGEEEESTRNPTPIPRPGWIETTIQFVDAPDEFIGSFVAECIDLGAVGSAEAASVPPETPDEQETACKACGSSIHVQLYFPESAGIQGVVDLVESRTSHLKGAPGAPSVSARILRCRRIDQEDWATCWKGSFPPERVAGRFWVLPPWRSITLPAGAVPIILEPGLAFGTGKHQTTMHCLEFLEDIAGHRQGFPRSCLDAGCGSGILSIAAVRLGATRVVGLDIDPDAIAVASRNLALNGLSAEILLANGPLECLEAQFELITANLDATTLQKHEERLWSLLTAGGLAVLSGMLEEQKSGVAASFCGRGFQPLDEKYDREEGWTSLLLRKP